MAFDYGSLMDELATTAAMDDLPTQIRALSPVELSAGEVEAIAEEVRLRGSERAEAIGVALQRRGLRAQVEEPIEHEVTTDRLTGLLNARQAELVLNGIAEDSHRRDVPFSVFVIDLDRFKSVNDLLGHRAGDLVLREAAEVIRRSVRAKDIVARYGGDEFVVILPETGRPEASLLSDAIRGQLAQARLGDRGITISVGVATFDAPYLDSLDLLHNADEALHFSKILGRDRVTHWASIPKFDPPAEIVYRLVGR